MPVRDGVDVGLAVCVVLEVPVCDPDPVWLIVCVAELEAVALPDCDGVADTLLDWVGETEGVRVELGVDEDVTLGL